MARLKVFVVVVLVYFAVAIVGGFGALNPSMKAEAAAMTAVLFLPYLLIALVIAWWATSPDKQSDDGGNNNGV